MEVLFTQKKKKKGSSEFMSFLFFLSATYDELITWPIFNFCIVFLYWHCITWGASVQKLEMCLAHYRGTVVEAKV
jgi:hypothetical protein